MIAWSNTAIPNPDGSVRYVIGTGTDVTDRRSAEDGLRWRTEDLMLLSTLNESANRGDDALVSHALEILGAVGVPVPDEIQRTPGLGQAVEDLVHAVGTRIAVRRGWFPVDHQDSIRGTGRDRNQGFPITVPVRYQA